MPAQKSSNLPRPGAVYLDHTGHFVADAASAARALAACGFTVTPYSAQMQPDPVAGKPTLTGTGNICVMLREGYLEFLVQTADTPLGREFRSALDRRAGLHLAAFGVADAASCHAELQKRGHAMRPLVRMSRPVGTEEGTAEARFTVARLDGGAMPEGRVQLVSHATESALWQPRWLDHQNGAQALASLVISSPDPQETAGRYADFIGRAALPRADGAFDISLDRGRLEILPEAMAGDLIGQPVEPGRPAFAACRLRVGDLGRTRQAIEAGGGACRTEGAHLILPFPKILGPGAWIFETAGEDQSEIT